MRRARVILALGALLGLFGGVVTAAPALAGRGDGWQYVPIPRHFPQPAILCGFKIQGTQLVDKIYVKALKSPDGTIFLFTGAAKIRLTNPANGKTITQNTSGQAKVFTNPDGSTTVVSHGHSPVGLLPAEQKRFGLPGLFIVAGTVTLTSPDGIHTTALTLHGHIEINVCAALS